MEKQKRAFLQLEKANEMLSDIVGNKVSMQKVNGSRWEIFVNDKSNAFITFNQSLTVFVADVKENGLESAIQKYSPKPRGRKPGAKTKTDGTVEVKAPAKRGSKLLEQIKEHPEVGFYLIQDGFGNAASEPEDLTEVAMGLDSDADLFKVAQKKMKKKVK